MTTSTKCDVNIEAWLINKDISNKIEFTKSLEKKQKQLELDFDGHIEGFTMILKREGIVDSAFKCKKCEFKLDSGATKNNLSGFEYCFQKQHN